MRKFFEDLNVGMKIRKTLIFKKLEIDEYVVISKDGNSIHQGKNPVIPGVLILCKIAGIISAEFADTSMVSEISCKFRRPLYLDNNPPVAVIEITAMEGRGFVTFSVNVTNNNNKQAVVGYGKVFVPKNLNLARAR